MNDRTFGPLLELGGTNFRLWAPAAQKVDLLTDRLVPMIRQPNGWYNCEVEDARAGTRYQFRINDELVIPDPASHFQPSDVSGPSQVIDHSTFQWRATNWRGRPWHETVLLESHVGTFTADGTYRAMIDKLDHLVDTGITALELMPLADFPGKRNWGYDGVLWYAPDSAYGTPDDLKTLIDEAHLRGLMVFLDVVYNHFGPDGNYLGAYAPQFFCDAHTPWGSAIDYRVQEVRAFAVENALHWLTNYQFDGLRLDAVHAIIEQDGASVLTEISIAVDKLAQESGRHIHLVLENDDNRASLLTPTTSNMPGRYRAQWNDDYHHAWHVLLTGECSGYYCDYAGVPQAHLAKMLRAGFAYSGEPSEHRDNKPRGEPTTDLSPLAFVNFLQNHDQIGNRAFGDRLETLASSHAIEAALAITLLAPMPPMLFMGEEWGAKTPFPFFCDFQGDLADAIRAGRRREFAQSYAAFGDDVPDPLDEQTFRSATLDWRALDSAAAQQRLTLVRQLLAIRQDEIIRHLTGTTFGSASIEQGNALLRASWRLGNGSALSLIANISDKAVQASHETGNRIIWGNAVSGELPPWTVIWSTDTV